MTYFGFLMKTLLTEENRVLFRDLTEYYTAQETASQIARRICSKEVREEPGYIGVFAGKKPQMCSRTSKDYR